MGKVIDFKKYKAKREADLQIELPDDLNLDIEEKLEKLELDKAIKDLVDDDK